MKKDPMTSIQKSRSKEAIAHLKKALHLMDGITKNNYFEAKACIDMAQSQVEMLLRNEKSLSI